MVISDTCAMCCAFQSAHFLNYTFLKGKASKKFDKTLEDLFPKNSDFKDFAFRMKHLPQIMRLILVQMNFSHKMHHKLKYLFKDRKDKESSDCDSEKKSRDNDTRWPSTYREIDRFLYFRKDILHVLGLDYRDFTLCLTDFGKFKHIDKYWEYLNRSQNFKDYLFS